MHLPRFPKLWCMVSHTPFLFLEARALLCRNSALLSKHQKAPSSLDVSLGHRAGKQRRRLLLRWARDRRHTVERLVAGPCEP